MGSREIKIKARGFRFTNKDFDLCGRVVYARCSKAYNLKRSTLIIINTVLDASCACGARGRAAAGAPAPTAARRSPFHTHLSDTSSVVDEAESHLP